MDTPHTTTERREAYVQVAVGLLALYLLAHVTGWQGSAGVHTALETATAVLALAVSLVAFVRYLTERSNAYLFLSVGFLGTGLMDGHHVIVTSGWLGPASVPDSLAAWSWTGSRIFLAVMMLLSWGYWRRERRLGEAARMAPRRILAATGALTMALFAYFAFVPLPPAYYPEFPVGRPAELVAGALFAGALAGYLGKGAWRHETLDFWIVLSLGLGIAVQVLFMVHSERLFDASFMAAHVVRIASYACVLGGLMASAHELFAAGERSARELQVSEAKLRSMFENIPDGIYRTSPQGRFLAANPALVRMLGYESEAELAEIDASELYVHAGGRRRWTERIEREGSLRDFEVTLRGKNGEAVVVLDNAHALRDSSGDVVCYEGMLTDITDRKRNEERLARMARFDNVTDLPNRFLFEERLQQAFAQAARSGERFAIHCLDLDTFKTVNDTFGHMVGDELLRAVGRRLSAFVRDGDTLARLGGDEFVVLQRNAVDIVAISVFARRIRDAFAAPFTVSGHEIYTSTSIGIAISSGEQDPAGLLIEADMALYKAKESGRNTFQLHDEELANEVREHALLHQDLPGALEKGEFVLEYQPQFSLAGGHVTGIEALVRWRHPRRGLLYPDSFIPICERSGLIVPLGDWVLQEACRQRQEWTAAGLSEVPIAVNISPVQLGTGEFAAGVIRTLHASGLEPRMLEIELTESVLMKATDSILAILERLRAIGVRFAIDDFGTGHSSLRYLRAFRAERLKIAMEFVQGLGAGPEDDAIVGAVVGLGHKLGRRVIAEGVETAEQLAFLRESECEDVQGSYFSPPLAPAKMAEMLAAASVPAGPSPVPPSAPSPAPRRKGARGARQAGAPG